MRLSINPVIISTGWEYHGCPNEVTIESIDIIDARVCIILPFSRSHLLATAKDGQANITWDIETLKVFTQVELIEL